MSSLIEIPHTSASDGEHVPFLRLSGKHGFNIEPMHVACFRGVDNAEEIRDLVREGVRVQRNAGLGDADESRDDDTCAAVAELLAEARALRSVAS